MGFSSLIRGYFSNLFVSIVFKEDSCIVFSKVIKNGRVETKFEKSFDAKNHQNEINPKLEKYLISLQEEYSFTHISLFLNSLGQGAIHGVKPEDFEKFSVDSKNVKLVKFKNWSAYVPFIDINRTNKIYDKVGLDYIYSPFVVLYYLLSQHKPQKKVVLYMLNQQDSVTLSIFKDGILSFGVFAKIAEDINLDEFSEVDGWENEEEKKSIADDMDVFAIEIQEKEEFSDLEDMADSMNYNDVKMSETDEIKIDKTNENKTDETQSDDDKIDNMPIDIVDKEEIGDELSQHTHFDESDEDLDISDIKLHGRDMKIFRFLNRTLKEYYKNDIYEGDFVSNMVIFDGHEINQEMLQAIKDELFLSLEAHKIDINETVCDISVKEANHEL